MRETLKAMLARATGLPPEVIRISSRPPLDHQSNRLYDVWAGDRHLIAKEYLQPDELQDAPSREFRALELMAPMDIAPRPLYFQPVATPSLGPVVVYDFMEGHMWDRRRPTADGLARLAEVWVKINSAPADGLWLSRGHDRPLREIEANFLARFQAYAEWVAAEFTPGLRAVGMCLTLLESRRAVVDELSGCDPLVCFCRADPRFANVIERPDGQLGLVDWEDSGRRDPARDLADIVTHANQEDLLATHEWQPFVQPYLAVRSRLDQDLPHRTHLYLALFPIFWLAVLLSRGVRLAEAGRLEGWMINGLPANDRLRRYLARAVTWPEKDFARQLKAFEEVEFLPC